MATAVRNLINGNVTAAKNLTLTRSSQQIYAEAINEGCSIKEANATANYLKGRIDWQTYCDACFTAREEVKANLARGF